MDEFGVEITFPRDDTNPTLVLVTGKNQEAVLDCIDYLKNEEEDYLAEHTDKHQYIAVRHQQEEPKAKAQAVQVISTFDFCFLTV